MIVRDRHSLGDRPEEFNNFFLIGAGGLTDADLSLRK
jgi:hypothetical protein